MSESNGRPADAPVLRESPLWPRVVIEDIQTKAQLGRYRMQGFSMHRVVPNLDDLTFVPCTLSRVPLEGYREKCETRTVLGTRFAANPVVLDRPITIAGMSYGALSRPSQDGARHRREAGGDLHHHRRRRHVPRGARGGRHHGLPGAPVPVRVQPRPHEDGAGHRDRRRPGRQARDRRRAAGVEGLRGDRRAADAARRRRPAFAGPASRTSSDPTTCSSRSRRSARRPTGRFPST